MFAECVTWRPISATDAESCSVAAATVCTLIEVSCAAAATAVDLLVFSVATADIFAAVARISAMELATISSTEVA
jgi:hypothetical protein